MRTPLLECGSLLPPCFGEACFASHSSDFDTQETSERSMLTKTQTSWRRKSRPFRGRGSKLPRLKAQASLHTPKGWAAGITLPRFSLYDIIFPTGQVGLDEKLHGTLHPIQ
jgi:hypothetical protein